MAVIGHVDEPYSWTTSSLALAVLCGNLNHDHTHGSHQEVNLQDAFLSQVEERFFKRTRSSEAQGKSSGFLVSYFSFVSKAQLIAATSQVSCKSSM